MTCQADIGAKNCPDYRLKSSVVGGRVCFSQGAPIPLKDSVAFICMLYVTGRWHVGWLAHFVLFTSVKPPTVSRASPHAIPPELLLLVFVTVGEVIRPHGVSYTLYRTRGTTIYLQLPTYKCQPPTAIWHPCCCAEAHWDTAPRACRSAAESPLRVVRPSPQHPHQGGPHLRHQMRRRRRT